MGSESQAFEEAPAMKRSALALHRIAAFCVDWLVIVLWGGALFVVTYLYHGGMPERFAGPWVAQGVCFLVMTLPVVLYFSLMEASAIGGTLGKRMLHIRVVNGEGERIRFRSSLLRSGIKFAPWEAGHLVAQQAFHLGEGPTPAWLYLSMALSTTLPLWWLFCLFRANQTPYDVLAGTTVLGRPGDPLPRNP
ncbi:MAG: RDD family protein [Planctomycetota bacterium]|jgi:uncharacterized RDD family membrane protein YckC